MRGTHARALLVGSILLTACRPSVGPQLPTPFPTPTPDHRVFNVDSTEIPLLAEELPGDTPYLLDLLTLRHNSEILTLRGEQAGREYLDKSGRVIGVVARYSPGSPNADSPLLAILVVVFKSAEGPTFLFTEKGGPCREDESQYALQVADLGLGDRSVVCASPAGSFWVRVHYRNVYFDVATLGSPDPSRRLVVETAVYQLAKLHSFPLSSSVTLSP